VTAFVLLSCNAAAEPDQESGDPAALPQAAATCSPAPLTTRAASVLIAGLPETLKPNDPLVGSLAKLGVGGVLLTQRNVQSTEQVQALTAALRKKSPRPLYITTDEEGGEVSSFRPVLGRSDSAYSLGSKSDAELFARGRLLGAFLKRVGINGDLAPVTDVTSNAGSAIGSRSYSADAHTVTTHVLATARGLSASGVAPTVKHFPGLGRPDDDTHTDIAVVDASRKDLENTDLAPFRAAIAGGVPVVMVGHAVYPSLGIKDQPASMSPAAYALLRELGFQGVAMTDSLGMGAVNLRYDYPVAAVQALRAGADALLFTDGTQAKRMRDAIVNAVQRGQLSEGRLNEAAARTTALAGGDPMALSCVDVRLPSVG
jgi:beta-N-acetylhexosaminidase